MATKPCWSFVTPEHGLDVCHGANSSRVDEFIADLPCLSPSNTFGGCREYHFPPWLSPMVKVLWVMFAFQERACTAVWLTYYFWSNKTYRQAVFKYANPVDNDDYKLKQFAKKPIADTDLVYGHKDRYLLRKSLLFLSRESKVFHFPLRSLDKQVRPKHRVIFSFLVLYAAFLALVGDFFIDVYFLHGLSTDQLIDVKYIHFDEKALVAMVFFEVTAFLCLPLTAYVFKRLSWKRNLRDNIYGEVIIVSLAYILEDGPELLLQYYWVDRYAGMKYNYPDGTSFSGRATIVCSSAASLTVAIVGIVNLISLYKEFTFWLKFRAIRNYLADPTQDWTAWGQKEWITIIPSILYELEQQAEKEALVERVEQDMRRIQRDVCKKAYEEHLRSSKKQQSFEQFQKKFIARMEKTVAYRMQVSADNSSTNLHKDMSSKIKEIQNKTRTGKSHNAVLLVLVIFGLIPLIVNLLRLSSAIHQIFVWRKYKHNCLKFIVEPGTNYVSVDQRGLHKHECWGVFEWPFFIFNGLGLLIHTGLLIGLVLRVFVTRNDAMFADEQFKINADESDSESEHSVSNSSTEL